MDVVLGIKKYTVFFMGHCLIQERHFFKVASTLIFLHCYLQKLTYSLVT